MQGQYLAFDEQLSRPNLITIINDTLAVIDEYALIDDSTTFSNNMVHLFCAKDGSYLQSLGETGRGPGELTSPWTVDNFDGLWVFDLGKYDYLRISNNYNDSTDVIDFSTPEMYYPTWISDTSIASLKFTDKRFLLLNKAGKILDRKGEYPIQNDRGIDQYMFAKSFQGVMRAKPDGSKLVVGNRFYDFLEIWIH